MGTRMRSWIPARRTSTAPGFALIVTISLLVLLTVLGVGMLSVASLSLRESAASQARQTAMSNARLGLLIALGELQNHLGPDARATARAETLAKDPRVGGSVEPNTPPAWWVGVSHGDGKTKIANGTLDVVWLVSGLPDNRFAASPRDPVAIIGEGTIDLADATGNQPIEAGRVPIQDPGGTRTGSYAWIVDDHGMKAQLAASDAGVRNDANPTLAGGVLPGTYPLDILPDMAAIGPVSANYQKVNSLRELQLVGMAKQVARAKFFSFTTRSRGVLSNPRRGGLKKDLTIAFENSAVFDRVFPASKPDQYLLIDPAKRTSELAANGYIHWGIFRDYYNLKKFIRNESGTSVIDMNTFSKNRFLNPGTPFTLGQTGPHEPMEDGQPYGTYVTLYGDAYVFNPLFPVLSRLQQNAWVDYIGGNAKTPDKLRTNVQLWTSHYNPHNISLSLRGDLSNTGARIVHFPLVAISAGDLFTRADGLDRKVQCHAPVNLLLKPGRSQVFGFGQNRGRGGDNDDQIYSAAVKDLTFESVFVEYELRNRLAGPVKVDYEFFPRTPALMVGADHKSGVEGKGDDKEVSQLFFTPIAWDRIPQGKGKISTKVTRVIAQSGTAVNEEVATEGVPAPDRPGIKFSRTLSTGEMNRNSMVSHALALRTTREAGNRLRPLADANIRAVWHNPRWDSALNLPNLAVHSADTRGKADERFVPMDTSEPPYGFTYWGAGTDPQDGNDRVILFDVPRRDLVSLGQLQHAAAGRFSYEPTYVVGNSYANPRIPLPNWKTSAKDTFSTAARGLDTWKIPGSFNLYDASYLVNEAMWDGFIFTTIPQNNDNHGGGDVQADYPAIHAGKTRLPNPRFLPYQPAGSSFDAATLRQAGTATTGSFFHNAGHLLVDGAFNVNSTSVDAWEAFLSGTHKLPTQRIDKKGNITGFTPAKGIRFPRVQSSLGDGMERDRIDDSYWTGFRELSQKEVRELAAAIVGEIRERGPFPNLADFINRRLDYSDAGRCGALQAALDRTVNKDLDPDYERAADSTAFTNIPSYSTQGAGFPGQLLQGDLLQALSPYMTTRSDTFTIRAYGEARAPDSDKVLARAWCEAVVQRYPDPCPPEKSSAKGVLGELASPSSRFGREFRIVTFRWLSPAEV